jgi:hypothetical protein
MRASLLLALLVLFSSASFVSAQVENAEDDNPTTSVVVNPAPPKTKLEAAAFTKGVLVVGGFTDVGTIAGEDGGGVKVTAVEYTNSATQEKHYGLVMTVHQAQGNRTAKSYIDDDEIDDLLNALQSMERMNSSVTQLGDFTARFRTKGDFEIGNVASDGAREMVIRSVQIEHASGEMIWAVDRQPLTRLGDVLQCITSAKQKLDGLKGNH